MINKYLNKQDEAAPDTRHACDRCGFDFNVSYTETIQKNGVPTVRRMQRNRVDVKGIIRCDVCYDDELIRSGKYRWSGTPDVLELHKQGISRDKRWWDQHKEKYCA